MGRPGDWSDYRHYWRFVNRQFRRERPDIAATGPQMLTSAQMLEAYAAIYAPEPYDYDREQHLDAWGINRPKTMTQPTRTLPTSAKPLVKRCAGGCGRRISSSKRLCRGCRDLALQQVATRISDEETLERVLSSVDPGERDEAEQLMRPYLTFAPAPDCPDCGMPRGSAIEHECAQRLAKEFAAQIPDQAALDQVIDAEPSPAKRAVLIEYLKPYLSFTPAEDIVATEDCPRCGFRRGTILPHECVLAS